VVVSDGVGSKPKAHYGSRAACKAVARAFHDRPAQVEGHLGVVKSWWLSFVAPFEASECAATCLFVVRPESGPIQVGILGDGLGAVLKVDGTVEFLEYSKAGGFANVTTALSASTTQADWKVARFAQEDVQAVLLCTDGIADDLEQSTRSDFVLASTTHFTSLSDTSADRRIREMMRDWPVPGHTDDKTMACLVRRGRRQDS
jgi:serine/threonine protein phosphatase PrpC